MSIIDSSNFFTARKSRSQYQVERSLRFNSADSAYLNRTPASAGNRKTWTWSAWVKRSALSTTQALFGTTDNNAPPGNYVAFRFSTTNTLEFFDYTSAYRLYLITTQVFRDTSGWYHIVLALDTTQATAANRIKLYINGSQVTVFSTATYPTQNLDSYINNNEATYLGAYNNAGTGINVPFSGYLTEINFIDGQALTPSSFGETDAVTGVWKPKRYSGSGYGTNGFFLKFADNSNTTAATLGKDSSGNGNNWTPNNFSVTAGVGNDSMIDTPTPYADGGNGRGNYCTLNPISGYSVTLTNGNLDYVTGNSSNPVTSNVSLPSTGKWYWEVTVNSVSAAMIGVQSRSNLAYSGPKTVYYQYGGANLGIFIEGTANVYNPSSYTDGDVIGVAFDATNSQITWYKNNTQQGGPFSLTTVADLTPIIIQGSGSGSNSGSINFGQRAFAYTPPSGFLALNTQNLPEPTIKKPNQFFDVVTRNGFGSSGGSITSLQFQPDFLWNKARSLANSHNLIDAVRGVTLGLKSDSTLAEASLTNFLTSFNSNGYTIGTADFATTATVVDWLWKESATPGFDIVTYTGNGANRTIAHSLGVAPSFMMVKDRDSGSNGGAVYHASLGNTKYLKLFQTTTGTDVEATDSTVWNNTSPTSSVFSVGTSSRTNANTDQYVAYLWSEVAGFSKFGSYSGTGVTDGPFVFCNFRPRWVLIKSSTVASSWYLFDAIRGTINVNSTVLYPDTAAIEDTNAGQGLDFTSNGFKVRAASGYGLNNSGATYIFAAYAESPFKYALAR